MCVSSQALQAEVLDGRQAPGGQWRQAELQVQRRFRPHQLQVGASAGQRQERGQIAKHGTDR